MGHARPSRTFSSQSNQCAQEASNAAIPPVAVLAPRQHRSNRAYPRLLIDPVAVRLRYWGFLLTCASAIHVLSHGSFAHVTGFCPREPFLGGTLQEAIRRVAPSGPAPFPAFFHAPFPVFGVHHRVCFRAPFCPYNPGGSASAHEHLFFYSLYRIQTVCKRLKRETCGHSGSEGGDR